MEKDYQTKTVPADLVLPDAVTVAIGELAETVREGLLALAVGAGLQVMQVMMGESVASLCGPKGAHDPERTAVRHGHRGRLGHPWRTAGAGPSSEGSNR